MSDPAERDPILTAEEVARDLRISKTQVHRLLRGTVKGTKAIPFIAIGRRQLIRRSSLEAWKRENETGGGGGALD